MFYSFNPTKLINGPGSSGRLGLDLQAGSNIAILCGSTYELHKSYIERILADLSRVHSVEIIRMPSGEPSIGVINHLLESISDITDFIIGIGGGSVMDATKALAVCKGMCINAEQLEVIPPLKWHSSLRYGLISTRPGSGSENNNAFVLMDEKKRSKKSYFSIYSYPAVSIQDSQFYSSLSSSDFAGGLIDSLSHILDQYLVDREPACVQDMQSQSLIEAIRILSSRASQASESDFLELAWLAASISSGYISRGVITSWLIHEVAHALASIFQIDHVHSIYLALGPVLTLSRHPRDRMQNIACCLGADKEIISNEGSHIANYIASFVGGLGYKPPMLKFDEKMSSTLQCELATLTNNLSTEEITFVSNSIKISCN